MFESLTKDARFNYPVDLATDGTNVYVSDDDNNCIRKVVASTGVVTTLAGNCGSSKGYADGTGTNAEIADPFGLTITADGSSLYLGTHYDDAPVIRRITIASGVVTSVAGSTTKGSNDGTGTNAGFWDPLYMTLSSDETKLYVSDRSNHLIRQV